MAQCSGEIGSERFRLCLADFLMAPRAHAAGAPEALPAARAAAPHVHQGATPNFPLRRRKRPAFQSDCRAVWIRRVR